MNWLVFALIAPALYTLTIFIDKYILERQIKDYLGLPIFTGFTALGVGTLVWIANGYPLLNLRDATLIILSGMLILWGLVAYYKALTIYTGSLVNVLMEALKPVIVLILSIIFLSQALSLNQYLGFFLVLAASFSATFKRDKHKIKISSVLYYLLVTTFFWSIAYILVAFVTEGNEFKQLISYESVGVFLGSMTLYVGSPTVRKAFKKDLKLMSKLGIVTIVFNESLYVLATFCTFLAISLGPVALVAALEGTQVFYGLIYGTTLAILAPKIYQEKIDRRSLIKNIILSCIVFAGVWLISS